MKVTKVAGNVYMLREQAGTLGLCREDGIVVVDDSMLPWRENPGGPEEYFGQANTLHHQHPLPRGPHRRKSLLQKQAPIIAHDNVRKRLEKAGDAGNGSSVHFEANPSLPEPPHPHL